MVLLQFITNSVALDHKRKLCNVELCAVVVKKLAVLISEKSLRSDRAT